MAPAAAPPTQAVPTATAAPAPLAWSEDADESDEPVPYTGGEHSDGYGRKAAEFDDPADQRYADEAGQLPWYKRTALVLTVAGALLAVLVAIVLALTLGHQNTNPVTPPTAPPPRRNRDDHRARQQHIHVSDPAAATPHDHLQPAAGDDVPADHHVRAAADHDCRTAAHHYPTAAGHHHRVAAHAGTAVPAAALRAALERGLG